MSADIITRMERNCLLSKSGINVLMKSYLRSKFVEASNGKNTYTVCPSFYVLFREISGASHEMFADALNESGKMQYFSSKDSVDENFGSHGR